MTYKATHRNTKTAGPPKGVRAYASQLRAEQAEQTRLRIIRAYGDEICRGDRDDITVQRVARRAGVSVPTLYRNFASLDALGDAFWTWFEPQIASFDAIKGVDDLPAFAEGLFKRFGELEPFMRALLLTAAGRRLRERTVQRRNQAIQRGLAPLTKRMSESDARAVVAVLEALCSGHVWLNMHQDWDLDGVEAGRAVAWALRALIHALRRNPNPLTPEKPS